MNKIVLMVEDDVNLLKMNIELLKRYGYIVHGAKNMKQAKKLIDELLKIDLAILDVLLPDGSGFELATILKNKTACPVLMLTSKSTHEDIVEGMNSVADMYMTKPFVIAELIARVEGLIKKHNKEVTILVKGELKLDTTSRQAMLKDLNLALTPKDFTLLFILARSENEVVSTDILYEKVWGQILAEDTTALRSAITRLRKKIVDSGYTITSYRNEGYAFERN